MKIACSPVVWLAVGFIAACSSSSNSPTGPGGSGGGSASSGSTASASSGGNSSGGGADAGDDAGMSSQTHCQQNPSKCGYPDATNTGVPAGTMLAKMNGDLTISTANTVIDGKDITGCITVTAPGVIIKRSKITCDGYYGILTDGAAAAKGAAPVQVEDVEIVCGGNTTAIADVNFAVKRAYIHGCENGFSIDRDVQVEDTFITDIVEVNGGHGDGIQFGGTPENAVIRHNSILVKDVTSAINWTGDTVSVLAEKNLFAGGAYTVYCPRVPVPAGAFKVIDNRLGDFTFGHSDSCDETGVVFTGNYEDADLKPITP